MDTSYKLAPAIEHDEIKNKDGFGKKLQINITDKGGEKRAPININIDRGNVDE